MPFRHTNEIEEKEVLLPQDFKNGTYFVINSTDLIMSPFHCSVIRPRWTNKLAFCGSILIASSYSSSAFSKLF